jgi:hypothetical protein
MVGVSAFAPASRVASHTSLKMSYESEIGAIPPAGELVHFLSVVSSISLPSLSLFS